MIATKAPRLGALAVEAEGWLRLFRGGVFEDNFLDISGIDAGAWETARAELTAASLLAVEWEVLLAGRPYLRLPEAKAPAGAASAAVRARYIEAYRGSMMAVRQAFHGPSPKLGMDIMAREEANFRQAVAWTRDLGDHAKAAEMADLFTRYLERAGRADDRDLWLAWLAGEGPDEEAAVPVEEVAVPEPPEPVVAAPEAVTEPASQETEGTRLLREGGTAVAEGQIARAAELYQRALRWFQEAQHTEGVAETCQRFGELEEAAGRPEGARVWYERAAAKRSR